MTPHCFCSARRTRAALAHTLARPSCRSSPPEYWRQSPLGAGKTEGKIEGDDTARCWEPYLHKGWRGTRCGMARAVSKPVPAPVLAKRRAEFAEVRSNAMEQAA